MDITTIASIASANASTSLKAQASVLVLKKAMELQTLNAAQLLQALPTSAADAGCNHRRNDRRLRLTPSRRGGWAPRLSRRIDISSGKPSATRHDPSLPQMNLVDDWSDQ